MESLHSQPQYAGQSVIGKGILGVCSGGYRGSVFGTKFGGLLGGGDYWGYWNSYRLGNLYV